MLVVVDAGNDAVLVWVMISGVVVVWGTVLFVGTPEAVVGLVSAFIFRVGLLVPSACTSPGLVPQPEAITNSNAEAEKSSCFIFVVY